MVDKRLRSKVQPQHHLLLLNSCRNTARHSPHPWILPLLGVLRVAKPTNIQNDVVTTLLSVVYSMVPGTYILLQGKDTIIMCSTSTRSTNENILIRTVIRN